MRIEVGMSQIFRSFDSGFNLWQFHVCFYSLRSNPNGIAVTGCSGMLSVTYFLARLLPKADNVMPVKIPNCLNLTPNRMQNYK